MKAGRRKSVTARSSPLEVLRALAAAAAGLFATLPAAAETLSEEDCREFRKLLRDLARSVAAAEMEFDDPTESELLRLRRINAEMRHSLRGEGYWTEEQLTTAFGPAEEQGGLELGSPLVNGLGRLVAYAETVAAAFEEAAGRGGAAFDGSSLVEAEALHARLRVDVERLEAAIADAITLSVAVECNAAPADRKEHP